MYGVISKRLNKWAQFLTLKCYNYVQFVMNIWITRNKDVYCRNKERHIL